MERGCLPGTYSDCQIKCNIFGTPYLKCQPHNKCNLPNIILLLNFHMVDKKLQKISACGCDRPSTLRSVCCSPPAPVAWPTADYGLKQWLMHCHFLPRSTACCEETGVDCCLLVWLSTAGLLAELRHCGDRRNCMYFGRREEVSGSMVNLK